MPGRTMEAKPSDSPSESSPEVDLSSAAGSILASINALLDRVGIPAQPITSFEELRKSASSMFVAIFEAMFQVRQKGVVRKPAHVHNYVHNAQVVIDALAGPILNIDLSHITGEAIVRGDTMAIRNLLDVFMCISTVVLKRRVQEEQAWLQSTPAAGKAWPMSVQRQRPRALRPGGHGPLHLHLGEASRSIPGQPSLGSRMRSKRSGRGTPGPRQVHAKDGGRHVAVDAKASAAAAGPADEAKVGVSGGAQLSALELSAHDLGEGEEQPDAARNGIKGPGEDSGDSAPEPHSEEQVEYAGVGEQPLREADLDLRVEEEEEEEDERQAHLPMHLHLEEGGEEGQGGRTSPGFVWRNKLEPEDERELRARLHYQRVLNDRLSALRKRELLDARKHQLGHKNAKHLHRVRQVKRERMAERLHLGSLSMRMQDQTQAQDRVGHIYKKILTALHRQRKEDDREDAARLRAMHLAWRAQADDLERFFNDRVSMVLEHERQSGRQRAQAMRAEERVLAGLLKKMEQDYEKRLARQIESEVVADKVQARRKAEAEHMYRELLKVEDWSANGKDRFMGFRPKANFEQGIKQVRARADSARLEHKRNKQRRNLARAYGT